MRKILSLAAVPLLVVACSSGDSVTDPEARGGSFKATIDGQAWSAGSTIQGALIGNYFSIGATSDGINIGIAVVVDGTGTYDLASSDANGSVTEGGQSWYAAGQQGGGTVTFTTLDAHNAKGTFSFDAGPIGNSGTGVRKVTNGSFDFTY
ncbi:MAG: DUF6252 family protein [Gemmatimonadota bacterium]|jgi:hypothetical protein